MEFVCVFFLLLFIRDRKYDESTMEQRNTHTEKKNVQMIILCTQPIFRLQSFRWLYQQQSRPKMEYL